jgi:hypothetical protein
MTMQQNRQIQANVSALSDKAVLEILFLADAIRHEAKTGKSYKAFQMAYAREVQHIRNKPRPCHNNASDLHRFGPNITQVDPA